jgi:two-component system sensor histidine kinase RpfC
MELTETKFSLLKKLNQRLKGTGDSEPEQAKLRLLIAAILVIYFCVPWSENERFIDIFDSTSNIIIIAASSIALLIFAAIVKNPRPSPLRRVCGILLDMISLSILMYWTGGDHVPLFVFYLWVTLGNGFRYGTRYLYISFGVSLIGFTLVTLGSEYWQEHRSFAFSLLLILLVLPLYAAFLLEKLHAAIAAAKQANEAKSRFLANMSHELRTPLNGVIGMGDLLRETRLSHEQRELVGTLHSSAYSLLDLIENVLDIAKIESGRINIENKALDLYAVVNAVIYMLSPTGEAKNLLISCSIDPGTPFSLKGDHQHLRQVLINLVNNAIKFTDEGSVNLRVFRIGGSDSNPRIRFEVKDTGVGIPAESLDTIFDDFTQAEQSSIRSYGGTGLGTTISKELVELMGGEIGVESEHYKGSKFWFDLPFEALPHNDRIISSNHILLLAAEDTAAVIRPSLKGWDIDFDWVRSSARAFSILLQAAEQGNNYHSVIVDQDSLNDINAEQFAQMVRSEKLLESVALILVNSSDTMININAVNQYYISTILEPEDKRSLFNAIHAAQSAQVTDENVVTLAEHYSRQAGSKALNILVAEDNSVNQQVIQGILRHAGHNVRLVARGDEVLDILETDANSVDMLILDMNMPEMNGLEVVKTIRFMDTRRNLPVIMLTADATPEARQASTDAGTNAFLTKPVNARALLDRIASLSRDIAKDDTVSASNTTYIASHLDRRRSTQEIRGSQWYDESAIRELSALGDYDFLFNLIRDFQRDGIQHVARINEAAETDYPAFREALHALKGSSIELGAKTLSDICQQAEALKAYDIGSDTSKKMAAEVQRVFLKTSAALSNALKQDIAQP